VKVIGTIRDPMIGRRGYCFVNLGGHRSAPAAREELVEEPRTLFLANTGNDIHPVVEPRIRQDVIDRSG
jgi:hypothetical protein